MKSCIEEGCKNKYYAKGQCLIHYLRQYRQKHPQYFKDYAKKNWRERKEYLKLYHRARGDKSLPSMNKFRFGGLKELVIQRDGERCVMCKMHRTEHRLVFNRDLTVNHIDHQSARSVTFDGVINNDPDNLETLCLRCHGAKDAVKTGKYATYLKRISAERSVI
jgi:5-methylcytosine-specific restriction endonuclease McrA